MNITDLNMIGYKMNKEEKKFLKELENAEDRIIKSKIQEDSIETEIYDDLKEISQKFLAVFFAHRLHLRILEKLSKSKELKNTKKINFCREKLSKIVSHMNCILTEWEEIISVI